MTGSTTADIAVINGGSSSIKFGLYRSGKGLQKTLAGSMHLAGPHAAQLTIAYPGSHPSVEIPAASPAAAFLVDWMSSRPGFRQVKVIGHRVVHGMQHSDPVLVTSEWLQELRKLRPFDPEHLPLEIELIEAFHHRHPELPQLACFDTAFHRGMPRIAKLLPLPHRLGQLGAQRYGFHGLSYTWLMQELARLGDPAASSGRVILAHLGNGASMAAVRDGTSIDTSMGFTPGSGLPMGTRSGDVDPGLPDFMARTEGMTAAQFHRMATHDSGLLGVSGISSDIRELLAVEARDARAAEAVGLFCYQAKKLVGANAAALGGLDTLVFSGGIGENAAVIRERICSGLEFLGISLDAQRNARNAAVISADSARATVRVIHTDEELVIARACAALLGTHEGKGHD